MRAEALLSETGVEKNANCEQEKGGNLIETGSNFPTNGDRNASHVRVCVCVCVCVCAIAETPENMSTMISD